MIGPRNSRLFAFEAAIQQELRNLEIKAGIDVPRLDGVDFKHLRSNAQSMSPAQKTFGRKQIEIGILFEHCRQVLGPH